MIADSVSLVTTPGDQMRVRRHDNGTVTVYVVGARGHCDLNITAEQAEQLRGELSRGRGDK